MASAWRRELDSRGSHRSGSRQGRHPRLPRSKKKSELIAEYCAGLRVEDLALPFFAVADDLTALRPVVFRSGPLALALEATSAIPTVFRPVRHEDQMLVDGWVCDPLPAGVVRAAGFVFWRSRCGRARRRAGHAGDP